MKKGWKKILLSLLAIALAGGLVGGGVLAAFGDAERSSGNAFAAGTLDLWVDGENDPEVPAYFSLGNLKPGDTGSAAINLYNAGTIDGEAYLIIENISDEGGEAAEPELEVDPANKGDLAEHLILTVSWNGNSRSGALKSLEGRRIELGTLEGAGSLDILISYEIPEDAGNEIQGDRVSFDILFGLRQA